MNALDDEFQQYLKELNDIVETVVLWITLCNYLDPSINEVSWPSWIHMWPSSFVSSAFTQPINTTFCFPLLTRSSTTICPRISSVSGLATTLWSAHFGGSVYPLLRTPIHNKHKQVYGAEDKFVPANEINSPAFPYRSGPSRCSVDVLGPFYCLQGVSR